MKTGFMSALLFGMVVGMPLAYAAKIMVVETQDAELRRGPSKSQVALTKIRAGTWVTASNLPNGGYYKVRTTSGDVGWVAQALLAPARTAYVEAAEVSLYEKPDMKSKVLLKLRKGDRVFSTGMPLNGFLGVRTDKASSGWATENSLYVAVAAQVEIDTDIRKLPKKDAPIVGNLLKGEMVVSGVSSKDGFNKVNTASGQVGWVASYALVLKEDYSLRFSSTGMEVGVSPPKSAAPPSDEPEEAPPEEEDAPSGGQP